MSKQKLGWLIIFLMSMCLFACQQKQSLPDGYFPYDKEKVESALQALSFEPKIPSYLPLETAIVVSDRFKTLETQNEALDVSFYTMSNDLLSIQMVDGELGQTEQVGDSAEVKISEQLEGKYVENRFAQTLYWEEEGITYKMMYRNNDNSGSPIPKDKLIKVAQSFHS
ncbi:DUF4367 domain-containing protein [Radiobacillus kanasensis]|uniref:DUF4367 domain-containing protein n=1 Tax=Radiobacillus kanasensis TaxID=2844358 RepID=UPI001E2A7235|nr:DUF4367 domain-containing protein [Radiobacillus kanasensis]UFU00384.1 DUF4367 domain-containing protein [Radiobacillus kanasensis]